MNILSNALVGILAGALIAGCSNVPYRTGKGNDHVVAYRTESAEPTKVVREPEVVHVERAPVYYHPVYRQRAVPAYRVASSDPAYATVTGLPVYQRTYTTVPVTRYYYSD